MTQTRVPGSRRLKYGLLAAAFGLVLTATGTIITWPTFGQIINSPTAQVPGSFERELDPGTYLLSILTSRREGAGLVTVTKAHAVNVQSVSVQGPDSVEIELRDGGSETVTRGNNGFSGVVRFDVAVSGIYTIDMRTTSPAEALVTPSITGLSARTWLGAGIGLTGSGIFLLGAVSAILGWFKKREPTPAPPDPPSVMNLPPPPLT